MKKCAFFLLLVLAFAACKNESSKSSAVESQKILLFEGGGIEPDWDIRLYQDGAEYTFEFDNKSAEDKFDGMAEIQEEMGSYITRVNCTMRSKEVIALKLTPGKCVDESDRDNNGKVFLKSPFGTFMGCGKYYLQK